MKKSNQKNSSKIRKKEKIEELCADELTEQQNEDIQTFAEIIVDIVMKELEKEKSEFSKKYKIIPNEKP